MKVTMISREYPPHIYGGAGVHMRYLCQELSKIMAVEVRCFGDQDARQETLAVKGFKPPAEYEERKLKFTPALSTFAVNLSMLLDEINSDVVHTHTWYSSLAGYLAKVLYKIPLVATCHSLEPLRPWKEDQLGRGYHLSTWAEKMAIEGADMVIAVSHLMKQDIRKFFSIPSDRITVIHNGIDLSTWKHTPITDKLKQEWGIQDDYVLFVGRPTKQKGMEYLIEARDLIDPKVQIVMGAVGADTKEYEEELRKKIANKKGILWINKFLKENEYVQLYSSAKVFVCPSIYEPFGIINLEAMSCRTPVVATAVGGIKEVVVPEETGILIEPGSPRQIAEAVNRLLKDRPLARRLGEHGRWRVEEHFSWELIAKQTKALYESLLARKPATVAAASDDAFLFKYKFDAMTFETLRSRFALGKWTEEDNVLAAKIEAPDSEMFVDLERLNIHRERKFIRLGRDAISGGQLGCAIVNGGMATRFGGKVKGIVEVFDFKSFLQLKLEQIQRINEEYEVSIPIYIMNSFATEVETIEYLKKNNFFGVDPASVHFFNQFIFKRLKPDGTEYTVDPDKSHERYYGPGHGDFVHAFKESGFLDDFIKSGGHHLWYSNVDNLGATIDERILGYHIDYGNEMTVEVAKKYIGDKGGAPALVDGSLQIVEGFKFPPDFDQDSINVFNTATYIFQAQSLTRPFALPWYITVKDVGGDPVIQFERLSGDLSMFLKTGFLVIDREQRFFPIKTPEDLENQREKLKRRLG